jgi:effector-binding domain-containing protein
VPASDGVEIVDLPVVQVASIVHRGGMEGIVRVYEALIRWIEDTGYRVAGYSRELYHDMGADGPRVTELQMPIAK